MNDRARRISPVRHACRVLVVNLVIIGFSSAANAALLGLNPRGGAESDTNPDITTFGVAPAYNGAGHLTADGTLKLFNNDLINAPSDFHINLTIDPNTGHPIFGTLSITGTSPRLGGNSGTLLTGSISQFDFPIRLFPGSSMATSYLSSSSIRLTATWHRDFSELEGS